jgi:PEP-CTERM motif
VAQAYGGAGGATVSGTASQGGDATAKANLTSYVADAAVNAEADAYAGAGGSTGAPGQYALSGQAIAHATVSSFGGQNSALAVAGTLAPGDTQTSPVDVTASSQVTAEGAFASHALANSGAASYPTDPSSDVTAGFAGATALPTGAAVPGAPAGSTVLGTATITGDYVAGMSGEETLTDTVTFTVLASSLTGALIYVDGFNELGFTGSGNVTTVVNSVTGIDTVTLVFNATATGTADLSGTFAILDPPPSPGDSFNDVFGSFGPNGLTVNDEFFNLSGPPVPEPSTWAMLLVGFGALALRLAMGRKTRA